MKRQLTNLLIVLITLSSFAQVAPPEAFNFQAVIMDGNRTVKGKPIGVQISLYKGSLTGTLVYQETFLEISDSNGIVSLEVGRGNTTFGVFSDIQWGTDSFFIMIAADPNGGTDYIAMGGSQLLSVPYALSAKYAQSVIGDEDTDDTNEIQELSLENGILTLSKGGGEIDLPGNEAQNFYYADKDGDGYGDNWNLVYANSAPNGFILQDGDCDDSDPLINPGTEEICDGIDNNCDGQIDEGFDVSSDPENCGACGSKCPIGYSCTDGQCEPNSDDIDNDGYSTLDGDCDDGDPSINPGAQEICDDGIDQNCDGQIDEGCLNCEQLLTSIFQYTLDNCPEDPINCVQNSPGFELLDQCVDIACLIDLAQTNSEEISGLTAVEAANYVLNRCGINDGDSDGFTPFQGDCDDVDPTVFPGAEEICGDGIDQDCNGIDLICNDIDLDGFADINFGGDDCNDNDPTVYPGAEEICGDGIDQDCDGTDLDCNDADSDRDGYSITNGDCNDNDPTIYPGAEEICSDGIDQDCNGSDLNCVLDSDSDGIPDIDDNCPNLANPDQIDSNGNGIGDACEIVLEACTITTDGAYYAYLDQGAVRYDFYVESNCSGPPVSSVILVDYDQDGYEFAEGDCNDSDPTVFPGAEEICGDGIDQNCNGTDLICNDIDLDGFADINFGGDDCNDNDPTVYPGAEEICGDGIDQDCDGSDLICDVDSDGDGIVNSEDNCPNIANPNQIDSNGNGIGDACEIVLNECTITPNGSYYAYLNQGAVVIDRYSSSDCSGPVVASETLEDYDLDGYTALEGDCNDSNPSIYPGAEEICGDGIDQDCDGQDLICSTLTVTLTWIGDADMDLHLIEPGGEHIYFGSPTSTSGGNLIVDTPTCNSGANLHTESITYEGLPPSGNYQVYVDAFQTCGNSVPEWTLTITINEVDTNYNNNIDMAIGGSIFEPTSPPYEFIIP